MNNNKNNGFQYNYSAGEQAELKKIREKYITDKKSPELSTIEKIRKLDAGVTKDAAIFSLCLGVSGALIMGAGMSFIMTDLKDFFSISGTTAMIAGIIIGIIGITFVLLAYPLYNLISEKKRKKVAPEILRLINELLNEQK